MGRGYAFIDLFPIAQQGNPPLLVQFFPFIFLFVVLYFLIIRPQQKKQKEHQAFISGLEKNQEVVTSGGIHGTIVQVKEKTVTLRVSENTRIDVDKSSISHAKPK